MRGVPVVVLFLGLLAVAAVAHGAHNAVAASSGLNIPDAVDPVNPTAVPIGDGRVSGTPKVGYVDSCVTSFPSNGGAQAAGPWVNATSQTWDSETKLAVQGAVSWPHASFTVIVSGNQRVITGNDEPVDHATGTFPIAKSDPAYHYDANPNHIAPQSVHLALPLEPSLAAQPSCLHLGAIGILNDGVYLYDALDAEGRDAGAHEIQDSFQGHPDGSDTYHHHLVPNILLDNVTTPDSATLVGFANDGFGIYVERDASGNILTNGNLDACHGRTSLVPWDGRLVEMYHYDATLEYPYTVGCFMGLTGAARISTSALSTTATGSSALAQANPTSSTAFKAFAFTSVAVPTVFALVLVATALLVLRSRRASRS